MSLMPSRESRRSGAAVVSLAPTRPDTPTCGAHGSPGSLDPSHSIECIQGPATRTHVVHGDGVCVCVCVCVDGCVVGWIVSLVVAVVVVV